MSFRGSVIVALQTTWSSGVGASVGLEAGYTQLASGLARRSAGISPAPRRPAHHGRLRRGGAIRGAFGAPLAGAFYAFELVIGGYTPASLTPVGVAAVAGYSVTQDSAALSLGISVGPSRRRARRDLRLGRAARGLAALLASCIMRGVALCESGLRRPVCGRRCARRSAACVGLLALLTPQVMSSGHGALHFPASSRCRCR
jgi:CIC family chloride channel protein